LVAVFGRKRPFNKQNLPSLKSPLKAMSEIKTSFQSSPHHGICFSSWSSIWDKSKPNLLFCLQTLWVYYFFLC
jgi:hypothetical protein